MEYPQKFRILQSERGFLKIVGHDHFQKEAGDKVLEGPVPVHLPQILAPDLMVELVSLNDGPGDELRKKRLEKPGALLEPNGFSGGARESGTWNSHGSRTP